MVFLSAKLFKDIKETPVPALTRMLRESESDWYNPEIKDWIKLKRTFEGVRLAEDQAVLFATLRIDVPYIFPTREGVLKAAVGYQDIPFAFVHGSTFFIAFTDRKTADTAATLVANIVFGRGDQVLTATFQTAQIERFLGENPHTLLSARWAGLRIPGTDRAQLSGQNISQSPDFRRYEQLGRKKFIVVRLAEQQWTIGISEDGIVTFYTDVDQEEAVGFLRDKIIPLF